MGNGSKRIIGFTLTLFTFFFCWWLVFGGFKQIKNTMSNAVKDQKMGMDVGTTFAKIADDSMYQMSETTKKAQEKLAKAASGAQAAQKKLNENHWWNFISNAWNKHKLTQYESKKTKYESAKATDEVFQRDKMQNPYTFVKYGAIAVLIIAAFFMMMKLTRVLMAGRIRVSSPAPTPAPQTPNPTVINVGGASNPSTASTSGIQGSNLSMYEGVSEQKLNQLCSTYGLDYNQMTALYGNAEKASAVLNRYITKYSGNAGAILERINEDAQG